MRRWCMAAAIALGSAAAAYILLVRPWHLCWGATGQECRGSLPGDDLTREANLIATRAITVDASAEEVWPWVAQLGQGRGGFYSYDVLENLVGCEIHSTDQVVPHWQEPEVGDQVKLHPEVPLEVALVEPGEALVLRGGVPMGDSTPPYDFTWAFVLREQPGERTRLLVRERYVYTQKWTPLLVEPVEAISFVMSRKMLRGIRDRAESAVPKQAE